MAKQEREYQTNGISKIFERLDKGISRQIFSLCTGGGKTFVAARVAKRFNRILFLVNVEELAEQAGAALLNEFYPEISISEVMEQHGGLIPYFRYLESNDLESKFGIIKADMFHIDSRISIGSLQTIHRKLDRIPTDYFDLIIYDECHTSGAKSFKKTIDYFKPKLLLGLTATPYRADGAMLSDIFDEIVFQYGISDAIKDGYLCELDAIQVKTQIDLDKVGTVAGEFNQRELKQEVDTAERNKLIVDSYKKYAEGKQNLVFCVDVEHAMNLCREFKEAGYKAEFVVGDTELTPDRRDVINRFKSGETTILINVAVLIAGFDHPGIGCLTLASPTKSLTRYIQCVGRATRTLPGVIDGIGTPLDRILAIKASNKPHCTILDIVDVSNRHKIINSWTLDKDKPIKDRVFTTEAKKELLIEAKRKRDFEATTKEDKRINLFELPIVKLGKGQWTKDAATDAQLEKLRDMGYDVNDKFFSKGDANRMISNNPAPANWVWVLKRAGYNTSNGVTHAEAIKAFADMREREAKKNEAKQLGDDVVVQGL